MTDVQLKRGVLYMDGEPRFFLSLDYPYYRDTPENWQPRLRQVKELGVTVVTFYVPWRHHEVNGEIDFTGRTQPNRNVVRFLELIKAEGMQAVVKPGPFIHAETDFGGLPDAVEAGAEFEPLLGHDGRKRHWHRFLPAPLSKAFTRRVLAWFEACLEATVRPFLYPNGPVIALQVLNEGMYSAGNARLTFYDYSQSSLSEYRRRFGEDALAPRYFHPPTEFAQVIPYLTWGRWHADYMGELYRRYGGPLAATGLPVVTNQNPAAGEPEGMDWWITRVNPERWPVVHYGFTNWIGCVSHDLTAFNRYLLLCKRQPGPNLEENWGFSEVYDSRYRFTVIPFFQTVLAIAAGATGFNVYTGVGTAHWDEGLDSHYKPPYPDTAPIGADGTPHPKAVAVRLLAQYLNRFGTEIVTARREAPVSWGIYPPYAALASWTGKADDWAGLGVKPPRCGVAALDNFQRTMRRESRDFHLVNIEEAQRLDPHEYPALTFCGGFFMDAGTQARLVAYVRAGGTLILTHDMPLRDDQMNPCTILRDALADDQGQGRFVFLPENPFEEGESPAFLARLADLGYAAPLGGLPPETQAWVLHGENGADHYFVLSLSEQPATHVVGPVSVSLPGRGAAILRVAEGKLTAALIKGINDCDNSEAAPAASAGGVSASAAAPCDLLWVAGEPAIEVRP